MASKQPAVKSNAPACEFYYNGSLKKNVYTKVEIEPEFPGGAAAYQRFMIKNFRIEQDCDEDVTALPMPKMKFIVDTDGKIIAPCIAGKDDTTNLNCLEKATLRFLKKVQWWQPGVCQGKQVATEVVRPLAICIRWETE